MLRLHHHVKNKRLHYLDGLLSIMCDEEDRRNRKNQWFFHIRNVDKEHIIQPYNVTISNLPEEE